MISVPTRHLIVHNPGVTPPPVTDAFERLVADCNLWTESQAGITLHNLGTETCEARINVASDNPWPEVAAWWMNRPDYDVHAYTTVFLTGWDRQYIGWGGRLGLGGLSVVGEYAIRRILSQPTTPDDPTDWADPQSLVDDRDAGKLYLHEKGHELGLTHDFSDDRNLMSYGQRGYNSTLSDKSRSELQRLLSTTEDDQAFILVEACRR